MKDRSPRAKAPSKTEPSAPPRGLRAVRRDRVRAELIDIGLDCFKKRGFEATTINDIVEPVGLSPRTFFRYFKSKDDLVFDWMDKQGEFVRPLLAARPHSEAPLIAMEQTFLLLAEFHDANRKRLSQLTHLLYDTPSLAGRSYYEHAKWEGEFINILQQSRPLKPEEGFFLRVQVATAITAFVTAVRSWASGSRPGPLRPWVHDAFAALNGAVASSAASPVRAASD